MNVIDTVRISDRLRDAVPTLRFTGEGLLVILAANDLAAAQLTAAIGQPATITRPDGSAIELRISGAEVRHGAAGLYFEGLNQSEVHGSRE